MINNSAVTEETIDATEIKEKALQFLTQREHSQLELHQKLRRKYGDTPLIDQVITNLKQNNLQSDTRYCETYIQSYYNRGQGPYKIKQDLKQKGIQDSLIEATMNELNINWKQQLKQVKEKKFGSNAPQNQQDFAKQARFLQSRGFSAEMIQQHYKQNDE